MNNDWNQAAPHALARYAGDATAALDALIAATATIDGQPRLPALLRALCAQTLGLSPLQGAADTDLTDWRKSKAYSDSERAALAFAEQFCIDVSSLGDDIRGPFLQALGGSAFAASMSTYVADFTPRLRRTLERLFRPAEDGWPAASAKDAVDCNAAFGEFIRVVYNMKGLDPVLTELVRLRGARLHHCRLCKSLRAHTALAAGANETQFEAIDNYEQSDFSARQKAALALVDAIVWQVAQIPEEVIAGVRGHFTPAEAVELVLDVMRNGANKSAVAMAADAPFSDDVQVYDIDEGGNMHFGLEVPASTASA